MQGLAQPQREEHGDARILVDHPGRLTVGAHGVDSTPQKGRGADPRGSTRNGRLGEPVLWTRERQLVLRRSRSRHRCGRSRRRADEGGRRQDPRRQRPGRRRRVRRPLRRVVPHAYKRPLLATSTDGVGTKVAIAQAIDKHDTIGQDLVGMVVDDIIVVGATPLFMTDYIACGKVVPERIAVDRRRHRQGLRRDRNRPRRRRDRRAPRPPGPRRLRRGRRRRRSRRGRRTARRRPGAARRRRRRAVVVGPALQRILARAPHPERGRHRLHRLAPRARRSRRRGTARADAPLHRPARATARRPRPRRGRARAQPRDRRRHRRQPRPRAARRIAGSSSTAPAGRRRRCSAC